MTVIDSSLEAELTITRFERMCERYPEQTAALLALVPMSRPAPDYHSRTTAV